MAKRSQSKLARMRAQRAETAAARRRRELAQRYPDLPVQAWANMGDGLLGGEAKKVLRKWLISFDPPLHSLLREALGIVGIKGGEFTQRENGWKKPICR